MKYHISLKKGCSYSGIVSATREKPDVYVEDKAIYEAALKTGYFKDCGTIVEEEDEELEARLYFPDAEGTGHLDAEDLAATMSLPQLKKLAEDMGADTAGCRTKADYAQAIAAIEVGYGEIVHEDGVAVIGGTEDN